MILSQRVAIREKFNAPNYSTPSSLFPPLALRPRCSPVFISSVLHIFALSARFPHNCYEYASDLQAKVRQIRTYLRGICGIYYGFVESISQTGLCRVVDIQRAHIRHYRSTKECGIGASAIGKPSPLFPLVVATLPAHCKSPREGTSTPERRQSGKMRVARVRSTRICLNRQ